MSSLRWHFSSAKFRAVKPVVTRMQESWEKIKKRQDNGVSRRSPQRASFVSSSIKPDVQWEQASRAHDRHEAGQVAKLGHMPADLELNIKVSVINLQLHLDTPVGLELRHMTLVAQMQDTSLRYFWLIIEMLIHFRGYSVFASQVLSYGHFAELQTLY
jgi:hypothetical protein